MTITKEAIQRIRDGCGIALPHEVRALLDALDAAERERDALDVHYCALADEAKRQIAALHERAEKADLQVIGLRERAERNGAEAVKAVDRAEKAEAACAVMREALDQHAFDCPANPNIKRGDCDCGFKPFPTDAGKALLEERDRLRARFETMAPWQALTDAEAKIARMEAAGYRLTMNLTASSEGTVGGHAADALDAWRAALSTEPKG